jgi:hypothetical protein
MRSIRLELQDDQEVIVDLREFEDGLVYNYVSHWFTLYCTTLEILRETLCLNYVVLKDETM